MTASFPSKTMQAVGRAFLKGFHTSQVMVLAAACTPKIQAQEDRANRLDRLKAAVEAMAARTAE